MAILIYYKKKTNLEGDITEVKIWKVDKSKNFPHGVKYSLVYIHNGKRVLGYDNERSKGDHKHFLGKEEKYNYINISKLSYDFEKDVEEVRRKLYEN